jgi:uncharacterized protein (DUF2141 family)
VTRSFLLAPLRSTDNDATLHDVFQGLEVDPAARSAGRAENPSTVAPPERGATGGQTRQPSGTQRTNGRGNDRPGAPLSASQLQVEILDLPRIAGQCMVAIYDDAESFQNVARAVLKQSVPIKDGSAKVEFADLSAGTYAIAAFLDANGNGVLDKNLLGVPTEAYGFSNNARGRLGPPPFQQAAFVHGQDPTKVSIRVQ